jgi:tetratricopeptide (TPR) repeat protein
MSEQGLEAFQKAHDYAELAMDKGGLQKDDTRYIRAITGWGNCLNQLGRFGEALESQLRSLKIWSANPNIHGDAGSIVKLNLAYVYYRQGDLGSAEAILKQAQELNQSLEPVPYALANLNIRRGQIETGLNLHLMALGLYVKHLGEQNHFVADSLFKVGETYLRLGKSSKAW